MIPKHLQDYLTDSKLFLTALTHRSYCNEHPKTENYERLEFLGDAILEYIISKKLFTEFPEEQEGVLTAMRSKLVQTYSLSKLARELNLGEYMRLSKGEEKGGGRENPALLEDVFEALLGAIYLDQGMKGAHKFLSNVLFPEIFKLGRSNLKDPKSLFQEKVQAMGLSTPTYEVEKEEGPDHDKKFTIALYVGNEKWGTGFGTSKQRAQTDAAKAGLRKLEEK